MTLGRHMLRSRATAVLVAPDCAQAKTMRARGGQRLAAVGAAYQAGKFRAFVGGENQGRRFESRHEAASAHQRKRQRTSNSDH